MPTCITFYVITHKHVFSSIFQTKELEILKKPENKMASGLCADVLLVGHRACPLENLLPKFLQFGDKNSLKMLIIKLFWQKIFLIVQNLNLKFSKRNK